MRTPLIAGNWKMNGSVERIRAFGDAFAGDCLPAALDVAVIPPFPYLQAAQQSFDGTPLKLGAQTLNPEPAGAHTGEVNAAMLAEFGVTCVLVGHSERRQHYGETDADVSRRAEAALAGGLTPVLCVGETLAQREAGATRDVVLGQVAAVMEPLGASLARHLVIAYEPVWAIGTGLTATPEEAQATMGDIRAWLAGRDAELAQSLRLLYGGSMKADNAAALLAQPDIDGGLVGGASLQIDEFYAICQSAG
ncbi:triose-phosphate isomerase [Halomonas piscis]|uniref:Triosephosphate isomerase n=1 Tax=Halomonas piscis TaxID=3031727 RepID=A0ABY9Z0J4_9GAMM|nr:triose-phosphate isomerase [Halomonas piscis]WNK20640.1 triose-phosphate isomerase [Halomonas piscis]